MCSGRGVLWETAIAHSLQPFHLDAHKRNLRNLWVQKNKNKKNRTKKCQRNSKGIKQHGQGYFQLIGGRMYAHYCIYAHTLPHYLSLSLWMSCKYLRHFCAIILTRKVRKLSGARHSIDLGPQNRQPSSQWKLKTESRKLITDTQLFWSAVRNQQCKNQLNFKWVFALCLYLRNLNNYQRTTQAMLCIVKSPKKKIKWTEEQIKLTNNLMAESLLSAVLKGPNSNLNRSVNVIRELYGSWVTRLFFLCLLVFIYSHTPFLRTLLHTPFLLLFPQYRTHPFSLTWLSVSHFHCLTFGLYLIFSVRSKFYFPNQWKTKM